MSEKEGEEILGEDVPLVEEEGDYVSKPILWTKLRHATRFLMTVFLYSLSTILSGILMAPLVEDLYDHDDRKAALANGIMNGLNCLFQFISLPGLGVAADRFGRKKLMLLGIFGSAFEALSCAFAYDLSIVYLMAFGRSVGGFTGAFSSCSQSYVADATEKESRTKYFTAQYIANMAVPMMIAPLLGPLLMDHMPFGFVFSICALILIVDGMLTMCLLPESLPERNRSPVDWKRVVPVGLSMLLVKNRFFLGFVATFFIIGFVFAGWASVLFFYIRQRYKISLAVFFFTLFMLSIMNLITAWLVVKLSRKFGERKIAIIGLSFGALSMLICGIAPWFWLCFIGLLLIGFVPSALPVVIAILTKNISHCIQGEILSGINGFMLLAAALGAVTFPTLFYATCDKDGAVYFPGASLILGGLLLVVMVIILGFHFRKFSTDEIRIRDRYSGEDGASCKGDSEPLQEQNMA